MSSDLGDNSKKKSNRSLDFDTKSEKYNKKRPLYKKALGIGKITPKKFAEKQGEKISLKRIEDRRSLTPERKEKLYGIQKIILKESTNFFKKLDKNDFESAQKIIEGYEKKDKVESGELGYGEIYKNVAIDSMLEKFSSLVQEKDINNILNFINVFENEYGNEFDDIFKVLKNIEINHFSEEDLDKISEPLFNLFLSDTLYVIKYNIPSELNNKLANIMENAKKLQELGFISSEQIEKIKQIGIEQFFNLFLEYTLSVIKDNIPSELNNKLANIMENVKKLQEFGFISGEQIEKIKQIGSERVFNLFLEDTLRLIKYNTSIYSSELNNKLANIMENAKKLQEFGFISSEQIEKIKQIGSERVFNLFLSNILYVIKYNIPSDLNNKLANIMENIKKLQEFGFISGEQIEKIKQIGSDQVFNLFLEYTLSVIKDNIPSELNNKLANIMENVKKLQKFGFISGEQIEKIKQIGGERVFNLFLSETSRAIQVNIPSELNNKLKNIMENAKKLQELGFISVEQIEKIKKKGSKRVNKK